VFKNNSFVSKKKYDEMTVEEHIRDDSEEE
jgi:hypothetical protein